MQPPTAQTVVQCAHLLGAFRMKEHSGRCVLEPSGMRPRPPAVTSTQRTFRSGTSAEPIPLSRGSFGGS